MPFSTAILTSRTLSLVPVQQAHLSAVFLRLASALKLDDTPFEFSFFPYFTICQTYPYGGVWYSEALYLILLPYV